MVAGFLAAWWNIPIGLILVVVGTILSRKSPHRWVFFVGLVVAGFLILIYALLLISRRIVP